MENSIINRFNELHAVSGVSSKAFFTCHVLYLLLARLLGRLDAQMRKNSDGKESFFVKDLEHLRWENIVSASPKEQLRLINGLPTNEEQKKWETCPWMSLFLFYRLGLKNTILKEIAECFQNVVFAIVDCNIVSQVIQFVDELPIEDEFKENFEEYVQAFEDAGKFGAIPITPDFHTKVMMELLDPSQEHSICDPCCGSGKLLARAFDQSNAFKSDIVPLYCGYDIKDHYATIAAINMLLHNNISMKCVCGDTLNKRDDWKVKAFYKQYANTFDRVVCHPGVGGYGGTGEDIARCLISVVKLNNLDVLFTALTEHILKIGGRGVIYLPNHFRSRSAYKAMREKLVENNQLEALVFLPSNEFFLVFTKGDTTDKTLFYKFSDMSEDSLESFSKTWSDWKQHDESTLANFENRANNFFLVNKDEIATTVYDWSFEKYHQILLPEEKILPLKELILQIQKKQKEVDDILGQINKILGDNF